MSPEVPSPESQELTEELHQTKTERLEQARREYGRLHTLNVNGIGTNEDRQRAEKLYKEIKKLERRE